MDANQTLLRALANAHAETDDAREDARAARAALTRLRDMGKTCRLCCEPRPGMSLNYILESVIDLANLIGGAIPVTHNGTTFSVHPGSNVETAISHWENTRAKEQKANAVP